MSTSFASRASLRYARIGTLTIAAVYFLILVGGIVRASGAGMGCPDWPTCFGQWIPPTDESQLPANYHEIYADRGYADTRFNPIKTWTEYVNRLIGVTIGLLILMTLLRSFAFWRTDRTIVWLSLAVFLGVSFQAWLGSAVVASNLRPVVITAHMVMAFLIVCTLIYAVVRSQRDYFENLDLSGLPGNFRSVLTLALGLTLIQIAMGTQIRETVDTIAALNTLQRGLWRERFPVVFYIHRSFSAIILLTNLYLAWKMVRGRNRLYARFGFVLVGLVVAAIGAGVTLDRFGFPAVAQPLHLLLANLLFGTQFFLYLGHRYAMQRDSQRLSMRHPA
ncbi:MAG TPA: COX15/CtaA family protein [Methylococcus sp.]|nr:COX15/CtaA family protein [Methylococcus sp.]